MHESKQGYSLSKIESDFLKKGIKGGDAIRALKEIDYHKKREELKARQEAESSKKAEDKKKASKNNTGAQATNQKKSSVLFWILLLVIIGIVLYLYFSGIIKMK